eukprot:scaffold1508_cov178-Amphora_coffeaeformis.AAC.8
MAINNNKIEVIVLSFEGDDDDDDEPTRLLTPSCSHCYHTELDGSFHDTLYLISTRHSDNNTTILL